MRNYDIAKRYVAMCDVLGFRDLVRASPLPEVLDTYVPLITEAHRLTQLPATRPEGGDPIGRVLYDVFADSIVVWTDTPPGEEVDVNVVQHFFISLCKLIGFSLSRNVPIRVGVAYGECTMTPERKLYIGKSLVDAYDTERSQNWIGGACHDSCKDGPYYDYMNMSHMRNGQPIQVGCIIDHTIPNNRNIVDLSLALDWPIYSPLSVSKILNDGKVDPNNKDPNKWTNALEYYQERTRLWNIIRQDFV